MLQIISPWPQILFCLCRFIRPWGTNFEFEYLGELETIFNNNLKFICLLVKKNQRYHTTVPLNGDRMLAIGAGCTEQIRKV